MSENTKHKFNTKLLIAYDGTEFSGWQTQPNSLSVQEQIEKALKIILREDIRLTGSGRTDAGVHALGQVANFHSDNQPDLHRLKVSLNGILSDDIRILEATSVPSDFHARYSAVGKCYLYHIHTDPVMLPFNRKYAWHIKQKIDLNLLIAATKHFIGEKNFLSFANESHAGSAAKNPIRNLYRLDVIQEEGGIRLEFEGNGFLYKMVRNIVGTLSEVAAGKRNPDEIPEIFAAKDRKKAGRAAPPEGLFLSKVYY